MQTILWICEDCLVRILICYSDTYVGNISLGLYASCSSSSEDMQELAELNQLGFRVVVVFQTWACYIWFGWALCGAALSFSPAVEWLTCSYMDNNKNCDAVYEHTGDNEKGKTANQHKFAREKMVSNWFVCFLERWIRLVHIRKARDRSDTNRSV